MIKGYNPNIMRETHTVRIMLMQWDYSDYNTASVMAICKILEG